MKVLLIIGALHGGGAERQLVLLARSLRDAGYTVTIAVFREGGQQYEEALELGIDVVALTRRGDLGLVSLARVLRSGSFDVAYAFLPDASAKMSLVGWASGKTLKVWGVRASNMDLSKYGRKDRLIWYTARLLSRRADLIIANSHAGAEFHVAARYPADRMVVVPNGVDTAMFYPDTDAGQRFRTEAGIPLGVPVIGMLGRFDPMKGHGDFLEVVARVRREHDEVWALVVGTHTVVQRAEYLRRASELGVADRLAVVGATTEPQAALNAIDVLTLPSLFGEGFPNVVGEALACGVPCVAYRVGDVDRLLAPQHIVEPGDKEGLARCLSDFLSAPIDSDVLRKHVTTNYSVDACRVRTIAAIDELLPLGTHTGRRTEGT